MYTTTPQKKAPVDPTVIQLYRQQRPDMFNRSDEDIASMINNANLVGPGVTYPGAPVNMPSQAPEFARSQISTSQMGQPIRVSSQPVPSFKDQALGMAKGAAINEGASQGLQLAGVDAADVGGVLGAAKGAWDGYNILSSNMSPEQKAKATTRAAQDTGAAIATGGISSVAQLADKKLLGDNLGKFRTKYDEQPDPLKAAVNPFQFGSEKILEKGLSFFGSGKGKDQQRRDSVRKMLRQNKFIDEDWDMTLADGSKYDIGRDGGSKDETGRGMLELDFANSQPGDAQGVAIGNVNPLATIITGGDKKLSTDFATYFTKATMSNAAGDPAKIRANALKQYSNAGLDEQKALAAIDDLTKQGKVSTDDAIAFKNGISMLFRGGGGSNQASQGARRTNPSSRREVRPVDLRPDGPKEIRQPNNNGNSNSVSVPTPTAGPTTLSAGSSGGYKDNFAQNLANIYMQNQG